MNRAKALEILTVRLYAFEEEMRRAKPPQEGDESGKPRPDDLPDDTELNPS
jgi:hypothetical protein